MPRQEPTEGAVHAGSRGFRVLPEPGSNGPRTDAITAGHDKAWLDALRACLRCGIGVLISSTSDRGAISVTIFVGNQRQRSYASDNDEFDDLLTNLGELAAGRGGGG